MPVKNLRADGEGGKASYFGLGWQGELGPAELAGCYYLDGLSVCFLHEAGGMRYTTAAHQIILRSR